MRKIYTTMIERKYRRTYLEDAYLEYMRRLRNIRPTDPYDLKNTASISQVARDFGIGRSSLSLYVKMKNEQANEKIIAVHSRGDSGSRTTDNLGASRHLGAHEENGGGARDDGEDHPDKRDTD